MKGLMKTNPELARQRLELLKEAEEDILGLQKRTKDILTFRPDYDFRRYSEYGMDPSMADLKQMDMNQSYFYDTPSAMQVKMGGLMNFIPGIGTLKRGAEFIGGALKGILPENQRAIMENQARGAGIFTDDI